MTNRQIVHWDPLKAKQRCQKINKVSIHVFLPMVRYINYLICIVMYINEILKAEVKS